MEKCETKKTTLLDLRIPNGCIKGLGDRSPHERATGILIVFDYSDTRQTHLLQIQTKWIEQRRIPRRLQSKTKSHTEMIKVASGTPGIETVKTLF